MSNQDDTLWNMLEPDRREVADKLRQRDDTREFNERYDKIRYLKEIGDYQIAMIENFIHDVEKGLIGVSIPTSRKMSILEDLRYKLEKAKDQKRESTVIERSEKLSEYRSLWHGKGFLYKFFHRKLNPSKANNRDLGNSELDERLDKLRGGR